MGKGSIAIAFIFCFGSTQAQTVAGLQKKYAHHEVYEVRPGVQMAAKFTSEGLVCEIQLQPAHFNKDEVDLRFGLDKDVIQSLVDELVPASERGKEDKNDRSNGMVIGMGQVMEEIHSYSNVRVHVLSSHGTTVAAIDWRNRKCE